MVSSCFVPGCKVRYPSAYKVSTFCLPRDEILRKKWLEAIHRQESSASKYSRVCAQHFKESDIETEVSAYDPKTDIVITAPLYCKRLKKGVIPTLLLPTSDSVSSEQNNKLEIISCTVVHNQLKCVPVKSSPLKGSSQTTSPTKRTLKDKVSGEMVKRKRKSTASEASNKKLNNSSKLNGTHSSNGVEAARKSTDSKSKMTDKPVCTNPEAFAFLNVQVKKEPLSDEDMQRGTTKNNPEENVSENVQITNVRSVSSESTVEFPSAELNTSKRSDEGLDRDFYSKPLDMDERERAFGSFVACELSDLRANPILYMKTKQSILKLLTEAHFEQMSCGIKS